MKQIIQSYSTGEMWLADVPAPACRGNGVVVQTRASFVSAGTERMLVEFARKSLPAKALAMPDQVRKVIRKIKSEGLFPTLEKVKAKLDQSVPLGYSCAGIVEEVGAGVSGLRAGDRVACGGAGYANHAEYNYVPKNLVVRIPDGVSMEDASSATVGSIALQGVRQCDVRLGESVCVMGLGLLGLLAVQLLKASGCRVIGFDPSAERCALALRMGADATVSENLRAAAESFSEGRGVDAVLITAATPSDEPVTAAGEICRMKGRVVVTGLVGMDLPRDDYYRKEIDFKLSLSYGPGRYDAGFEEQGHDYPYGYVRWTEQRNIQAFLSLIAQGKIHPSLLITHRFAIDDALQAYEVLLGKTQEPYLGITLSYPEKELGQRERVVEVKSSESRAAGTAISKPAPAVETAQPVKTTGVDAVRVGFIGAGNFTQAVLLPALRKIEGVELRGVCTTQGLHASDVGDKSGFAYATTEYKKILEDREINTVFVATHHGTHAQFVCEALAAGKHVFVEKPLCMDDGQLARIEEAVRKAPGQWLMVGFNRRFSPGARMAAEYFAGRASPLVMHYRVNAGRIPRESWIQDAEEGGGRIIGECCHFIDLTSFLAGSVPQEVQALSVGTPNRALVEEDNVSFAIRFKDGSLANIVYVAVGSPDLPKEYVELFADQSCAVLKDFRETECFGSRGRTRLKGRQDKGFDDELSAFVRALRTGGPAPIPFETLAAVTRCSFAVLEALRTRRSVPVG